MASNCVKCGKKIPFFGRLANQDVCGDCILEEQESQKRSKIAAKEALVAKRNAFIDEIIESKTISKEQSDFFQTQNKSSLIDAYSKIFSHFESDNELDEDEICTLKSIQSSFGLSNDDVKYEERLLPYQYLLSIRTENSLPLVNLTYEEGAPQINLKKGETIHYASPAILKEKRVVSLGYQGGSHGISIPIAKGVRYHLGSHRGSILKEEQMVETSSGYLVITNKRLILNPYPGKKVVNIPLNKILSHCCYSNGVEIYKEGREKGFFFSLPSNGSTEVIGICLSHLLKNDG